MFMARLSERLSADAFTRASVEAYLRAVADERTRIELAIAESPAARDRGTPRARPPRRRRRPPLGLGARRSAETVGGLG